WKVTAPRESPCRSAQRSVRNPAPDEPSATAPSRTVAATIQPFVSAFPCEQAASSSPEPTTSCAAQASAPPRNPYHMSSGRATSDPRSEVEGHEDRELDRDDEVPVDRGHLHAEVLPRRIRAEPRAHLDPPHQQEPDDEVRRVRARDREDERPVRV